MILEEGTVIFIVGRVINADQTASKEHSKFMPCSFPAEVPIAGLGREVAMKLRCKLWQKTMFGIVARWKIESR